MLQKIMEFLTTIGTFPILFSSLNLMGRPKDKKTTLSHNRNRIINLENLLIRRSYRKPTENHPQSRMGADR